MRYLVPIAAPETLFPREEFHFPKPQIEIEGEPMIARVIANLAEGDPDPEFIFVVSAADCREFSLDRTLRFSTPGACHIVALERPTLGAACSALLAVDLIDDERPLLIANGDQLFDYALSRALDDFAERALDAGVVTFESVHPRWSYVRVDAKGAVLEAAEKRVISRTAIAGVYYFRRGCDFVRCAEAMILNDRAVDGKFFIAPALNEALLAGLKVGVHQIPTETYHSLYSPARVELYQAALQARGRGAKAVSGPVQVVVPMAGQGTRFAEAGYDKPKPFIDVAGRPMIERVLDNLAIPHARFLLICRNEHLDAAPNDAAQIRRGRNLEFLPIEFTTEGAACTVLLARARLDPEAPLLIANCDQIIDFDAEAFVEDCFQRRLDGSILCFRDAARDPKWSFAHLGEDGLVDQVQEKKPISDLATVGLYFFRRAGDFIDSAIDMISRNERVNGEFYVCPVYNRAIANGLKIGVCEIAPEAMHGLGTPEDLDVYLAKSKGA